MRIIKAAVTRGWADSGKVLGVLAGLTPACCMITTANAQERESAEPAASHIEIEEVVVTGTLLRGAAPIGSSLIAIGEEQVASTGAIGANQLLASVPQVVNFFNGVPNTVLTNPQQVQVARPNLRNLPGGDLATGAATLILIDGHRIAGVGVGQSAVDSDLIPTGAIERVEIVTDGGSSIYGADAVGGVINFITRRSFDGVQVDARRSFGDSYHSFDANALMGTQWDTGSVYVAYNYAKNDAIFGRDRDFAQRLDYSVNPPVPTSRECDLPNIQAGGLPQFGIPGTFYALPNLVPNTFNSCDVLKDSALLPDAERHGIFAGFSQNLGSTARLDVRAFYGERDTESNGGPLRASISVAPTNPYYRALPDRPTATQQVSFSFGPLLGNDSTLASSHFDERGISAELRVDLTPSWQLRTLLNYSESDSNYHLTRGNPALLNQYAAGTSFATAINPYDIASTQNRQLIADIANWEQGGEATDELTNARAIVDGTLFSLPGGAVRIAVGYEFQRDEFEQRFGEQVIGGLSARPFVPYKRDVQSGFGEIQVPIFSESNAVTAIDSLVLSVSGRYDDYSDFGDTFNPKYGIEYSPVNWLSLHGNWGESFNAPTLVDQLGSLRNTILAVPFAAALRPGDPPQPGAWTIAVQGSHEDLQPQTAKTWSVGFDIDYPFAPGLQTSVSYYDIFFKGTLGRPPVQNPQQLYANYPQVVTIRPTAEQIAALGALAPDTGGPAQVAQFLDGTPFVYQLIDFRNDNFGNTKLSGVDFSTTYTRATGFGRIDAGVSGNYQVRRETQATSIAPFSDDLLFGMSRFTLQTMFGVTWGDLRAQVTWNRSGGFDVQRTANLPQDRVSEFNTVDLFFRYGLQGPGLLSDLAFTLNVNNVADEEPPEYLLSGANGYANGFTLGRLFILGISKKF